MQEVVGIRDAPCGLWLSLRPLTVFHFSVDFEAYNSWCFIHRNPSLWRRRCVSADPQAVMCIFRMPFPFRNFWEKISLPFSGPALSRLHGAANQEMV